MRVRDVFARHDEGCLPDRPTYPIWPESGGLLSWGGDNNANTYFWLTDGAGDFWPVVSSDPREHGSPDTPISNSLIHSSSPPQYLLPRPSLSVGLAPRSSRSLMMPACACREPLPPRPWFERRGAGASTRPYWGSGSRRRQQRACSHRSVQGRHTAVDPRRWDPAPTDTRYLIVSACAVGSQWFASAA